VVEGQSLYMSKMKLLYARHGWIVAFAITIGILHLRRPDQFDRPQFWAEDGAVFFEMSVTYGWESLFAIYAGYFHTYQRIVASLAAYFPATLAPALYSFATVAMMGFIVWLFYRKETGLPYPLISVLTLTVFPHNGEILMQLVNVQFFMAVGLLLLLLMDCPKIQLLKYLDRAAVILFSLTGPFIMMWLPLVCLYYALRGWTKEAIIRVVLGGLCASIVLTAASFEALTKGFESNRVAEIADVFRFFGRRTIGELFIPMDYISQFEHLISFTILLVLAIFFLRQCWKDHNTKAFIFFCASATPLLAAALKHRKALEFFSDSIYDRYSFIPIVFFLLAWLQLAGKKNLWLRNVAFAMLIVATFFSVQHFRMKRVNLQWHMSAACFELQPTCDVAIHPHPWSIVKPARGFHQ
jgi:hypothetical protein